MTQNSLQKVNDRLAKLHGYAYFRPESGPLRERLTEAVLDGLAGDAAEQLSESPFGIEVNIGQQEGDDEVSVGFRVDYPGVEYRSQLPLAHLSAAELEDLAEYLNSTPEEAPVAETAPVGKTILRKKHEDEEYLEKGPAAVRLKVSPEWLKSVVPCTDYSYEEIEGKKYIREYYWSRELIERLFRIKSAKTTPEDLQYVAKECCEGDLDWARDLIGRLKSPNRPEPAPRDHAQKGQVKGATMKAQPGRQVQAKPAAPKPQPPRQGAANSQGAGNAAGNQGAAAAPAGEQRGRNRSRHRKPFRGEGKDRKPEQGGQKQPQQ